MAKRGVMVRIGSMPVGVGRRCSTPGHGRVWYRMRMWGYRRTRRRRALVIVPSVVWSRSSWFILGPVAFVVLALACCHRQSRRASMPFLPLGTFSLRNFYLLCRIHLGVLVVAVFLPICFDGYLFSPLFILASFRGFFHVVIKDGVQKIWIPEIGRQLLPQHGGTIAKRLACFFDCLLVTDIVPKTRHLILVKKPSRRIQ